MYKMFAAIAAIGAVFAHPSILAAQITPPSAQSRAEVIELSPGARVVALEQNTNRARSDDRWELGDLVRIGWQPAHGQVLR